MTEDTNYKSQSKVKTMTAIFIVAITLLIVGVSYAYFTATTSNSNNQQINLQTGSLSLIFSDNNNGFSVQLSPGGSAEKTFTIQNNGDKEAAASMSFLNLINTYMADSLLYSLSYSETENGTYKYLNIDNVPTSSTRVTREISNGIIVPANTTYYYKLRIKLVNLHETDQTSDLSATMNTKFRIASVNLPDNTGKPDQTLQKLQSLNETIVLSNETPDFAKTSNNSTNPTNGIYAGEDDYGTSYYFRGNVENNYVHFAGIYWRILRINGDGTLRLLYDGIRAGAKSHIGYSRYNTNDDDNAYVGYMYGYERNTSFSERIYETDSYEEAHMNKFNSTIKESLDSWYTTNLSSQSNKIADNIFCNDRMIATTVTPASYYTQLGYGKNNTYYAAYPDRHSKNPTLKCPQKNDAFTVNDEIHGNGRLTTPIGLTTVDELNMTGSTYVTDSSSYTYRNFHYWLLSPYGITENDAAVYSLRKGDLDMPHDVNTQDLMVPVINLTQAAVMAMTGSGTLSDPFEA